MHVDGVMLMKDLSRIRKIATGLGLPGSELAIRRALITASRELKLPCDLSEEERIYSEACACECELPDKTPRLNHTR